MYHRICLKILGLDIGYMKTQATYPAKQTKWQIRMMSDLDPFSAIPLSPPPAEINLDDLSGYQIFTLALTDYDHVFQPAVRALANIIASKITSLTKTEIGLLSDDEIGHLIETELSRLSDDEIFSLINTEISAFFDGLPEAILLTLATALADGLANMALCFIDFMEKNPTSFKIFKFSLCIGTGTSLSLSFSHAPHILLLCYSSSSSHSFM